MDSFPRVYLLTVHYLTKVSIIWNNGHLFVTCSTPLNRTLNQPTFLTIDYCAIEDPCVHSYLKLQNYFLPVNAAQNHDNILPNAIHIENIKSFCVQINCNLNLKYTSNVSIHTHVLCSRVMSQMIS